MNKDIMEHNIEIFLEQVAETKSMEFFFDFIKGLTNTDAIKAAYLNKTEELMLQFWMEENK